MVASFPRVRFARPSENSIEMGVGTLRLRGGVHAGSVPSPMSFITDPTQTDSRLAASSADTVVRGLVCGSYGAMPSFSRNARTRNSVHDDPSDVRQRARLRVTAICKSLHRGARARTASTGFVPKPFGY